MLEYVLAFILALSLLAAWTFVHLFNGLRLGAMALPWGQSASRAAQPIKYWASAALLISLAALIVWFATITVAWLLAPYAG